MNSQLIQQGRAAYRAGDFSAAAQMLGAAKTPDEIMGEADHLRGNALMHLGMYAEAAEAYAAALGTDLAAVDAKIEAAAGSRPLAFAYPFGFHSDQTEELLAQHGYQLSLTCENRINDLNSGALDLGRYNRSAHADRAAFFKMLGIV